MEPQSLFNTIVALCGCLGGWLLKMIYDSIKELRERDAVIETRVNEIQTEYVRREDFRDAVNDIKMILNRIDMKIDSKVDKA